MYPQLMSEIGRARDQRRRLDEERNRLLSAERAALTDDATSYSEAEVRGYRAARESAERQLEIVSARLAALESKLPSADEQAAAALRARACAEEAEAASRRVREAWSRFVAVLESAHTAGEILTEARQQARDAINGVKDERQRFGVSVPAPEFPSPDRQEEKLAGLLATFGREVAYGDPGETVLRDLRGLRAEMERIEQATAG